MKKRYLYIFLDESGNFDFSPKGTRFFMLTSTTKERPCEASKALHDLRYDLLESFEDVDEYFHASQDKQAVRNAVFDIISSTLDELRIDALIVEKAKTHPSLREFDQFYPQMLGYLLRYVLRGHKLSDYEEVLVFPASLHTGKQKGAMEKTLKKALALMLPRNAKYRLINHSAKSNFDIQIADYCAWAIFKKWSKGERRPYDIIKRAIRSEYDIFQKGTHLWY